jgi:hypothetical protein
MVARRPAAMDAAGVTRPGHFARNVPRRSISTWPASRNRMRHAPITLCSGWIGMKYAQARTDRQKYRTARQPRAWTSRSVQ